MALLHHGDLALKNNGAAGIEGDQVGAPEALAGDDEQSAWLQRGIGDGRIADDEGGDTLRQFHQPRLVHGDGKILRRRGSGDQK